VYATSAQRKRMAKGHVVLHGFRRAAALGQADPLGVGSELHGANVLGKGEK
jgi:hypothetical protein